MQSHENSRHGWCWGPATRSYPQLRHRFLTWLHQITWSSLIYVCSLHNGITVSPHPMYLIGLKIRGYIRTCIVSKILKPVSPKLVAPHDDNFYGLGDVSSWPPCRSQKVVRPMSQAAVWIALSHHISWVTLRYLADSGVSCRLNTVLWCGMKRCCSLLSRLGQASPPGCCLYTTGGVFFQITSLISV